jgi:hypothetical protein
VARAIKAGLVYGLLLFAAGFALGTLRELLMRAGMPRTPLVLAEIPVILAVAWFLARWSIGRFAVPPGMGARLVTGLAMLLLLRAGELGVGVLLMGHSLAAQLAADLSVGGLLEFLPQALAAAFPLLQQHVTR